METALDQGSAMVGERASGKARQAELGHGTAVLVRPRGGSAGRGWWRQCRAWLVAAVQGVAGGGSAVAQVARAR